MNSKDVPPKSFVLQGLGVGKTGGGHPTLIRIQHENENQHMQHF